MEKFSVKEGQIPLVKASAAGLLSNKDYYAYVKCKIEGAKKRVWGLIFIVNCFPEHDPKKMVADLINALAEAAWRGVDVKLVIPKGEHGSVIDFVNQMALNYAQKLGIDCKAVQDMYNHSMHSKYLIIDDNEVVLGSHNWTHNAFEVSNEDSVVCASNDLTKLLAHQFTKLWVNGKELELY